MNRTRDVDTLDLTVAIPAYNAADSIAKAIRSILAQTWQGTLEILVYNDGSTDGTPEIVRAFSRLDNRIRLIDCPVNKGRPFARNALLQSAVGKFFAWHDADDEWLPDKLEKQFACLLKAIEENGHENIWCTCSCIILKDDTKSAYHPNFDKNDILYSVLTGQVRAYLPTLLCMRSSMRAVGDFDEKLLRLQDNDFFLRFTKNGGLIIAPPKKDYGYVIHRKDGGKNFKEIKEAGELIIQQKHRDAHDRYGKSFADHAQAVRYLNLCRLCWSAGSWSMGTTLFFQALSRDPWMTLKEICKKRKKPQTFKAQKR